MLGVLRHRTYRHLFAAQVVALVGTGLATVALGLLAYDLAGEDAGAVLGTALAIKMVAYVTLAPLAAALARHASPRALLVGLDLVRAAVVLFLPFVTDVWQVYVLVLLLQAASAAFTPAFQATIPDVLPDEEDYTRALSLSQLASDFETLLSPLLAAALLTVVSFPALFGGTVAGFLLSALLVLTVRLPARAAPPEEEGTWRAATKGLRVMWRTPRLRGSLALELAVAAAGSMVLVNTVVLVRDRLALGEAQVALALGAFGGGSMLAALLTHWLLDRAPGDAPERTVMLGGGALMVGGVALAAGAGSLPALMALWAVVGFGFALTQTPIGRLLVRSARAADRPALYAAQFALSHAAWLLAYPLAGWVGAERGLGAAFAALTALGLLGLLAALTAWPARDAAAIPHAHPDLAPDHPHLREHGRAHAHPLVIDALHRHWPRRPNRSVA